MIDWEFIATLEGERLTGYVPDPTGSSSGVTIGTGVDLGNITQAELDMLPPGLKAVLAAYKGVRGPAAVALLAQHPLTLSAADVGTLDRVAEDSDTQPLRAAFYKATSKHFDTDLADAAQTVAASVTYQYGSLAVHCPHFWKAVCDINYQSMWENLRNFGDRYQVRRWREAAYLKNKLNLPDPLTS